MIIVKDMHKSKKLLGLLQKMIFFNFIKMIMILDHLMMVTMLVIIYTFGIYDIRKILKVLKQ